MPFWKWESLRRAALLWACQVLKLLLMFTVKLSGLSNLRRRTMVGMKEKFVSLIHVGDLVRGFVMAATSAKASGQTYFISSSQIYGWKEVGEVSRKVIGKNAFRIKIPEAGVFAIAAVSEIFGLFSRKPVLINFEKARDMVQNYWTCDSSKAQRDFGYVQEIGLEEGVRNTVEWYRSKGWL